MGTTTTTFALNKPTVGGDDGTWGTDWNTNADKLDDLLDGTTAIKPNLSEGLWKVGGVAVTATAAELNILDGVTNTVTAAEISYLDGVTDLIQVQLNARQPLDSQLTALAALSTSGVLSTNGTSVFARTLIAGTGITISNADGGTGNPNIAASVASQAQAEAGTDNITLMTPLRTAQAARPQTATAVASTSGTFIDFTDIPSWVKRVTVILSEVSTNGASLIQIQLGDSGGIEVTGYTGVAAISGGGGTANILLSSGFPVYDNAGAATNVYSGTITLTKLSGNIWIGQGIFGDSVNSGLSLVGGSKTISATLDRIRITTVSGTDTFDAGSINVMWE